MKLSVLATILATSVVAEFKCNLRQDELLDGKVRIDYNDRRILNFVCDYDSESSGDLDDSDEIYDNLMIQCFLQDPSNGIGAHSFDFVKYPIVNRKVKATIPFDPLGFFYDPKHNNWVGYCHYGLSRQNVGNYKTFSFEQKGKPKKEEKGTTES